MNPRRAAAAEESLELNNRPIGSRLAGRIPSSAIEVAARSRHRAETLGELELEHDQVAEAERRLEGGEIELPHPAEAFVIEGFRRIAIGQEPLAPSAQRVRVVQPKHLEVRQHEA